MSFTPPKRTWEQFRAQWEAIDPSGGGPRPIAVDKWHDIIEEASARFLETAISSQSLLSDEEANLFSEYFCRRADEIFGMTDKSKWLIVHPTANLQRERNTFRAAQL
jgi:hypothetical protein